MVFADQVILPDSRQCVRAAVLEIHTKLPNERKEKGS